MPAIDSKAHIQACDLCGLPCGRHPVVQPVRGRKREFCCIGCMNVYLILSESTPPGKDFRETELFRRSLELGLVSKPEADHGPVSPDIALDTECAEVVLHIQGMWCNSCAWLIERVVRKIPGIQLAEVSFANDLVKVKYLPQLVPPGRIEKSIRDLGYTSAKSQSDETRKDAERRSLLLRLGVAAFLWMNVMYLSMTLYVSFFEQIADSIRRYVPLVIWALATPVVFYCGYPILSLAYHGLRNRTIRAELLLSLGILAAYVFSIVQSFRGDPHIYFDTACVIVTLVLTGKIIERSAKDRVSQWITNLHRWMPRKARLLADGKERFASVEALEPGQVFVVKAGEHIVADGVVVKGESHADESLLTGEAAPVTKQVGDSVAAGSLNLDGVLEIAARRSAADSTLARIVKMVEAALSSRSDLERNVDRVAQIFVPSVVLLAGLAFLVLRFSGITSTGDALIRAITILVIACPCALGLATPLAITAAMGTASRSGILFRDSEVLETSPKVDVVILDKTGTATEGNLKLLEFHLRSQSSEPLALVVGPHSRNSGFATESLYGPPGDASIALSRLASLEQYSEHPLGKAFVAFARAENAPVTAASDIEIRKGLGISGLVDTKEVFAGNRRLLATTGIGLCGEMLNEAHQRESEGKTVTFFGWDNEVQGIAVFGDPIRRDAVSLVRSLKDQGISVILLSGDAEATTKSIASALHADHYESEVLPEDKAKLVKSLQDEGSVVAMVGDGVNDGPALAQADIGIAMGSGADLAMKAAAVVLMRGSLHTIPAIFALASRSMRIIRQNLFWAFFYNLLGIALAITGKLNPILAAGAMLCSSISVVANSMRLTRPLTRS